MGSVLGAGLCVWDMGSVYGTWNMGSVLGAGLCVWDMGSVYGTCVVCMG